MQIDLRQLLLNEAAITNVLGADKDGLRSIAWVSRPDVGGMPCITLSADDIPLHTQDGRADLRQSRVQIDFWANSYGEAALVCDRTVAFLEGLRGRTQGETIFICALLDTARDFDATDLDGGERVYRRTADFIISHR